MHRRQLSVVLWTLIIALALCGSLRADPPPAAPPQGPPAHSQAPPQPYLVLKGDNVGQTYGVSSPAYAYGWFGVCPRGRHVYDGTGYYNHYTQSSIRRGY
jgi:hypothetical protein